MKKLLTSARIMGWRLGFALGLAAVIGMSLPGTTVTIRDTPPARSAPLDESVWFVAGLTEKGPAAPTEITSLGEYESKFGARVSYGVLYDAMDAFFHEGGSRAFISRVLGPAAVKATHNFLDGAAAISLAITAENEGDWGNNITVAVVAGGVGGTFQLQVLYNGTAVEQSGDLATQQAAVDWATGSSYINATIGASALNPATVAAQALAGGTDDRASVTDAHWKTALDKFSKTLGPGQVSMPGRTTNTSHQDQLDHAAARNRIAILDGADTASKATLVTSAAAGRTNGRWGSMFAPWAVIPGIAAGTTRTVPYSAIEAGMIARNDGAGTSPNQPAAGKTYGSAAYAIGLSQLAWSDADRQALNEAGVNVAMLVDGGVVTYGYRTLADPATDPNFELLSNSRLLVEIIAQCDVVAERHMFKQIDGRGLEIADFNGDLTAELVPYFNSGSLYGATPEQAFYVDTGAQVNTVDRIAAGELHAVLYLKLSPFAERVIVEIVKRAITEVV